jgi:hypothetical protein
MTLIRGNDVTVWGHRSRRIQRLRRNVAETSGAIGRDVTAPDSTVVVTALAVEVALPIGGVAREETERNEQGDPEQSCC